VQPTEAKKIYDCFIFYNELEILQLRFEEMYHQVDHFVICEADTTFQGKPKPLIFDQNKERFAQYLDKVIHVKVSDMPTVPSPWAREHFQRNAIKRGLNNLRPNDIVLVSDSDEIFSNEAIKYLRAHDGYFVLDMAMYQFFANMRAIKSGWNKPFAYSWSLDSLIADYNPHRATPDKLFANFAANGHKVMNAGWHFTFLGGAERVRAKIGAYSHTESYVQRLAASDTAELQMLVLKDIGGGRFLEFCEIDESFPVSLRSHIDRYDKMGFIKHSKDRISELVRVVARYERQLNEQDVRYREVLERQTYQAAEFSYLSRGRSGALNLALNRPATQSSISAQWSRGKTLEADARRANNGTVSGGQGCHTDMEEHPWWQVDLENVVIVSEVWIYNRVDVAWRLKHFTILGSLDGNEWMELFRKSDESVFGQKEVTPYIAEIANITPIRYLRIRLDGREFLHFDECLVFGSH
jgi:beta-1,4-mannosyl-glycoprotein beta-1,4-N-acetylglucosaminyltransferase